MPACGQREGPSTSLAALTSLRMTGHGNAPSWRSAVRRDHASRAARRARASSDQRASEAMRANSQVAGPQLLRPRAGSWLKTRAGAAKTAAPPRVFSQEFGEGAALLWERHTPVFERTPLPVIQSAAPPKAARSRRTLARTAGWHPPVDASARGATTPNGTFAQNDNFHGQRSHSCARRHQQCHANLRAARGSLDSARCARFAQDDRGGDAQPLIGKRRQARPRFSRRKARHRNPQPASVTRAR